MPIKTLKLTGTKEIISKFDPEANTAEATVFTLRPLDSRVMGQINDAATAFAQADLSRIDPRGTTILNVHEANFKTCQFGLTGWRNLLDDAGNAVEFKTVKRFVNGAEYDVVDPDILKVVPPVVIDELGIAIKNFNAVTVADVKN